MLDTQTNVQNVYKKILSANVYDVAQITPLNLAKKLSKRLGNELLFKREDLQPVFSFKLRGAYNKMYQLSQTKTLHTVVAASAGNHAQGVALSAQKMGIRAIIVMPESTPQIKIDAVQSYGATAVLHGTNYDEACAHAYAVCEQENAEFIHPFDDEDVMAGQGTIGQEILQQFNDAYTGDDDHIDAVFIPVGGGGLLGGIASYIKTLSPQTKIIAVEPEDAASMHDALKAGERVTLPSVGIFADGVAVKQAGEHTFAVAKEVVDDFVLVNTDEICAGIKDIYDDTRSIAEPAGAVATAGVKKYVQQHGWQGKKIVALVCGANMNFDRLRHVSERAEIGEQREMLVGVELPEKAGAFKAFCAAMGRRNITEFNYRYTSSEKAHVFAGVELRKGEQEKTELIGELNNQGYQVTDLTDNEMAKLHVRYMIGGTPDGVGRERLLRFEFPECLGALNKFLDTLGSRWNISLFHYRNHGAAYGRVLVGLQIEPEFDAELDGYLSELGYTYVDETDNTANAMFLKK